ncbi:MAG: hypothetical protein IJH09_03915 [Clostridia bacterium]|nr:hypothetical protein [Clostridia bacterium]
MKRILIVVMVLIALVSYMTPFAIAEKDYSAEGWYTVYSIVPANYDHSYIYSQPSSTSGNNLGTVYDGNDVYVYYTTQGTGNRDSVWAYCDYNGVTGYIRYENLVYGGNEGNETSTDSANSGYIGTLMVANCDSFVSLRERPDTLSRRIVKVPKWELVEAYYYDSEWCECYYDGLHGYILRQYLSYRPSRYSDNEVYPIDEVDRYDLNYYEYRPVVTKGRGRLVFQKSPRGSFLSEHSFHDDDWIYVNVEWRQDGYAIAYEDGVYGYVDASYIDW